MSSPAAASPALSRGRSAARTAAGVAVTVAVALAGFWIAYDGGSFDVVSRTSLGLTVWWAIGLGVALGVWPRARLRGAALVAIVLLAVFGAWTAASIAWAESAEKAALEVGRVALYLGVYVLAVVAGTRASAARWADGLAVALVGIAALALGTRLFPGLVELSELERMADDIRLAYPLNYWNGLAVLVALAVPLLLRIAVTSPNPLARAAALAPFPALACVLYLTSSRGGFLAAAVGAVAFVLLSGRGWSAAAALAVGGAGGAAAIATLVSADVGAASEGSGSARGAALLVGLLCLGCGLVFGAASAAVPEGFRVPRPLSWAAVTLVLVLAAVGAARADPRERFEQFKQPPPALVGEDRLREHLTSTSGSGRWQVWSSAVDQFRSAPLKGHGGGSFEAWWTQRREIGFMQDAHSLYLETLGELGIVGFVLLLGALAAAVAAARGRVLRSTAEDRALVAALLASVAAFAVAAGIDWMWETTAVAATAFAALGLLARTDEPLVGAYRPRRRGAVARAGVAVAALALVAAQALILLTQLELRSSQDAAAAGRADEALASALRARALAAWTASPHLQLALVRERAGELGAARTAIRAAIERDRADWRLWLVAARLETKAGEVARAREALQRARELNPRSQLLVPK